MPTLLERLEAMRVLLDQLIADASKEGEQPSPEPEEPEKPAEPEPTPEEPEAPKVVHTLTLPQGISGEWANGVSVQTKRITADDNEANRAALVKGNQLKFTDGSTRTITKVSYSHNRIWAEYSGSMVDGSKVGQKAVQVLGSTADAPSGSDKPAETEQPAPKPDAPPTGKRKGMVCTNLGMGQGAPNRGVGTQGTDYNFPIESEITRAKGYGFTRFRVGGLFERFFKKQGSTEMYLGKDAKGKEYSSASVIRVGQLCKKHGCTVLWNPFHNYGTVFGKKVGSSGGLTAKQFGEAWRAFILHVKSDPDAWAATYGFDLMNEWSNMDFKPIFDATQAVLDACGDILEDKFIVPEGKDYSSTANWVRNNDGFTKLVDPRGPGFLEFSGHLYLDSDASGYYKTDEVHPEEAKKGVKPETVGTYRLTGFADWLDKNGYRGNIGETIVVGDFPRLLKGLENMLIMARDRGIDVYIFGVGDWFSDNYSTVHNLEIARNKPTLDLVKRFTGVTK